MREKRDFGPVLLKFGVAVALSIGGILYTILRNKRTKPSKRPPSKGMILYNIIHFNFETINLIVIWMIYDL